MKIDLVSDLHLEFGGAPSIKGDGDVLILAGDIHLGLYAYDYVYESSLNYENVIYVLGNHEFYGNDYHDTYDMWEDNAIDNVHVLNNDSIILGNVKFICSTMWTHGMLNVLNDYRVIMYNGRILTPYDTAEMHQKSKSYIDYEVSIPHDGKKVVVTHHAPIPECVSPRFMGSPINCMFHANMSDTIKNNDIDYWLHGHMHDSVDLEYENTRIICNPRGYPSENNNDFKYPLQIKI